jgi:hypothetical protein
VDCATDEAIFSLRSMPRQWRARQDRDARRAVRLAMQSAPPGAMRFSRVVANPQCLATHEGIPPNAIDATAVRAEQ